LIVWEVGVIEPAATALETDTFSVGSELGLLVRTRTQPDEVKVTLIWGSGVPLLLPVIVPPDTLQVIEVVPLQLPAMV
jgi:hypothetical protein